MRYRDPLRRIVLGLVLAVALAAPGRTWAASSPGLPAPSFVLAPGEITEFDALLPDELRRFAGDGRPHEFTEARCAVALPANFTPTHPWPILLVSATSDPGYNSSRRLLRDFAPPALAAGWIVVAADPPRAVSVEADTDTLRYALLAAALTRLREAWPASAEWPRAFGGFSGGAKRSAILGAISALLGRPPIGIFQAGCNQPVLAYVLKIPSLPREAFLATPVFLSSGHRDPIATPAMMDEVAAGLRRAGYGNVKLERFDGGHEVNAAHVEEALRWFGEENARRATLPSQ